MTHTNLATQWLPITERRKNACRALSTQFINKVKADGWQIDDYTDWFIDSVFQRILVGPKAYRVYDAHDPESKWYNTAYDTIKDGTLHHMYLKDNGLQYGLVRDSWCNQLLSTGLTKEETVYNIAELVCNNTWFRNFVEKIGIRRKF